MSGEIEKLSKLANVCAKEMELNPNARDLKVKIDSYKNILGLL
jgi:hypothetical protein